MPNLQLLTELQQGSFDDSPTFSKNQQERFFTLNLETQKYIDSFRDTIHQVGFLIQLAYFRASGKFFPNNFFKMKDVAYVCETLEIDPKIFPDALSKYSRQIRFQHQKYILNDLGWCKFTSKHQEALEDELNIHARKQIDPKLLLPIATKFLISRKIEIPTYYVLAKLISKAYNKMETQLICIVNSTLSKNQKLILDDLILIDDTKHKHYKYSALSRIKRLSYSTKIKDITESIKNYKLLKAFYEKFELVYKRLELVENATCYYSEWVSKSKLFQLKQFKDRSKAYLFLLAHLKHQYFKQTDLYVDVVLKLTSNAAGAMKKKLDKHYNNHIREQKKSLDGLLGSYNNFKQGYSDILNILGDHGKALEIRNEEARIVAFNKLKESSLDEKDIAGLIDKNQFNKELKNKLLRSIGASLQRKLTPIIHELDFEASGSGIKALKEIHTTILSEKKETKNKLINKGALFCNILESIKAGELNVRKSYNYLSIGEYFIPKEKWRRSSFEILMLNDLSQYFFPEKPLDSLKEILNQRYEVANQHYNEGSNKYLSFSKTGKLIVSTPKSKEKSNKNKLAPVFAQEGLIPIRNVLEDVNQATSFVKCFKHHALKKVIMKPTTKTIFAGLLSKGCNHGVNRMANISKGIKQSTLNNTVNWFFSLENIQAANNTIVDYINQLSLPNIYKLDEKFSHTSSDGQKFNVGVDSILANYSFKYFGQSQGISVYTFIDDRQVMFYDTIMSPGDREAAFVIDGLMNNNIVKSYIHSTDTHGYTEVIFAVMHFLGVSFAPRIKNIGSQTLYCLNSKREYHGKDYKIKPDKKINLKLIEDNWGDILRLIATIKTKTVTASQIFKRLNSYSKKSPLYNALKEFGRIIKTIYILTYIDDVVLRKKIEKQLNRIELFNKFAKAVFFANNQEFRTGSPTEQKIIVACKSFIQNCILLWNYLFLSQILVNYDEENRKSLIKTIKESSIISWRHINLHGEYDFTAANDGVLGISFQYQKIRKLNVG